MEVLVALGRVLGVLVLWDKATKVEIQLRQPVGVVTVVAAAGFPQQARITNFLSTKPVMVVQG